METREEKLVTTVVEGAIAILTVNRPKALNALSPAVLYALDEGVAALSTNAEIRAVILTGAGERSFVAGADISEMAQMSTAAISDYLTLGQRVLRSIERFPAPVVAAVNGFALGGGLELALSCDIIVAASTAKLGLPEVTLGIFPGFGGTQRLVQRSGIGTARRLIYSGEVLESSEALRLGVVDMVVEPGELAAGARRLAESIAAKAPLAVQHAKRVIRESQETLLLSGLQREVEGFLEVFATEDRREGMQAFLEKRKAVFKGR